MHRRHPAESQAELEGQESFQSQKMMESKQFQGCLWAVDPELGFLGGPERHLYNNTSKARHL